MVWSLSKDDDGLDSVHPLPNEGPKAPVSPAMVSRNSPPQTGARAVPTVVVDPSSQVPQAPTPAQRRRAVEATLVLKGRKLDEIRAEVARRKAAERRHKQHSLLLWAFAGGIALSLGWIVGITFGSNASDDGVGGDVAASPPAIPLQEALASPSPSVAEPATTQEAVDETVQADPGAAIDLSDLPGESEEPFDDDQTGVDDSATEDADGQTSDEGVQGSEDTFTLDDLPAD